MSERLGIVVSGSLNKGVEVKLDSSASIEDMAVGRFVTIEGQKRRFFGMITDVSLGVTDQKLNPHPARCLRPLYRRGISWNQHLRHASCLPQPGHWRRCCRHA